MLSVTESAKLLDVTPSRVRALIAKGTVPAEKVGHNWVLYEEDVMRRMQQHPRPGHPRAGSRAFNDAYGHSSRHDNLHELYLACREAFRTCPDISDLEQAAHPEEAAFYLAVADFFLQQKQHELVKQGVY